MSAPDSTLCQEGEDIDFLAACAASGEWSLFTSGVVTARHMNEDTGGPLAARLLEIFQDTPNAWPPKLSSLRKQYPELDWPDYDDGDTIDPMEKAVYVMESFRQHALLQAGANLYHASQEGFGSDRAAVLIREAKDLAHEVEALGTVNSPGGRFGANTLELLNLLVGSGLTGSGVTTPWPTVNDWFYGLIPAGLYIFYAQPKNGKSKLIDDIAIHNSLHNGRPGILVDQENPSLLIQQRLACGYIGLDWSTYQQAYAEWFRGGSLTVESERVLDTLATAVTELSEKSRLYILGQDDIDRDVGCISNETIYRLVTETGAQYVCYDQVHEGRVDRSHRKGDNFDQKASKVIADLSTWGLPVFGTTQENRKEIPKDYEWTAYTPQHTTVYGSSAAAFKCTLLCHVRMLKLEEPLLATTVHGESKPTRWMQILTPLLQRGGIGVGTDDRLFRLINDFDVSTVLDPKFGEGLMYADLARKQERLDPKKRKGKVYADAAGEGGDDSISTPASRIKGHAKLFKQASGGLDDGI